jgi:predicted amidohydrolase YtcJ
MSPTKAKITVAFGAALLIVLTTGLVGQGIREVPDAVFYNGKVITVDSSNSVKEAFAVRGDKFLAVGTTREMRALAGPKTQLVDLKGRAVMPGMMDNHNHAYHAAMANRGIDLKEASSLAALLDGVRKAASAAGPGKAVYVASGWQLNKFPEKHPPMRQDIDKAAPDNPVVIYLNRGQIYLNSAALKIAGVTRATNRIGRVTVRKDDQGEPDGSITGESGTVARIADMISPATQAEKEKLIVETQKQQLAVGLTSIRDLQLAPDFMRTYYRMWLEGKLLQRVSAGLQVNPTDMETLEDMLKPFGAGPGFGDTWLRLDCLAEFNPGSMWRSGNPAPAPNISPAIYKKAVLVANRYGWRVSPHTDSDGAMDLVLESYEAADRESSIRNKRWTIEHATYVQPDQMDRIKQLGLVISAQAQPYRGGGNAARTLGKERAERAVPIKEFMDRGIVVTGGSDWGGNSDSNNPFGNIYFYVTRRSMQGEVVGADQKISRAEALRVETINNAYLTFEEKIKGSIEAGKLADFVVLSQDVMTVPEEQIRSITPLATYVGGKSAYSSPNSGF